MSEDEVRRKSIEEIEDGIVPAVQALYTASKTALMYPKENPSVVHAVEAAREAIKGLTFPGGAFDVSFMEDKIVVNGEFLTEAMQKRGIFQKFHELMKNRRISSVTFKDGFTADELRKFLVLLGTRVPQSEFDGEGAIYRVLEEEGIRDIEVDEQVFVAISKREKVVDVSLATEDTEDASLRTLKDNVFARFLAGEISLGNLKPDEVKSLVADPEKTLGMVQDFVRSEGWEGGARGMPFRVDETRATLERLAEIITQVEDPHLRARLDAEVTKITSQIEAPELKEILVSSAEAGEITQIPTQLPRVILPLIGDRRFSQVAREMVEEYRLLASSTGEDDWPTERANSLATVLDDAAALAAEGDAEDLRDMIVNAGAYKSRMEELAEVSGTNLAKSLAAGRGMELCDIAKGPALVAAARYLFEEGEDELGDGVLDRLFERFRAQSPESRRVAAQQIWNMFKRLGEIGKEDHITEYVDEMSEALVEGRAAVKSFEELSRSMDLVAGETGGTPTFQEEFSLDQGVVSGRTIEKLMAADTGKVVEAVFRSGDKAARDAISKVLVGMEDRAVPALLDAAQGAGDEETLESVAGSLSAMGTPPFADIASRFSRELEPGEMVNLVRLVALIGTEQAAETLEQPLAAEFPEVRAEAVKALGGLGGRHALRMVLNASADLDIQVRVAAIKELASFHDYTAVRRLLELVTPGKKGEPPEESRVLIAAARSLGSHRVREAAGPLIALATTGKRHHAYPEEVRAAATASLGRIGGPEASRALQQLAKDSSMLVRSTARKVSSGA